MNGFEQDVPSPVLCFTSPDSYIFITALWFWTRGLDDGLSDLWNKYLEYLLLPLTESWKKRDKIFGLCVWSSYLHVSNSAL